MQSDDIYLLICFLKDLGFGFFAVAFLICFLHDFEVFYKSYLSGSDREMSFRNVKH